MLKFLTSLVLLVSIACERPRDAAFVTTVEDRVSDTPYHVTYKTSLKSYSLVLFINSASCKNTISFHSGAQFAFEGLDVGIMTVDKAGTRTGTNALLNLFYCSDSYWNSNHPSARTDQILSALNSFQSKNLGWNGKLYLVGAYEGALPAISLAKQWPNVEGLILLSIGTGLKDSSIFKKALTCEDKTKNQNAPCTSIENSISTKLSEIKTSDPNSTTTWTIEGLKGTSKWFQEMLSFDLVSSLDFKLPKTLIIHGGRDYIVPLDTLNNISKTHPEVELKVFSDLDQGWMDSQNKSKSQDVQLFVRDWIKKSY